MRAPHHQTETKTHRHDLLVVRVRDRERDRDLAKPEDVKESRRDTE